MNKAIQTARKVSIVAAAIVLSGGLSACTTQYTGPVEVTRFVAENPVGLGDGPIHIYFPEEMSNEAAKAAFASAIEAELTSLGYETVPQEGEGIQVATVRTSRGPIASAGGRDRSPVRLGMGAGNNGVGMGLGINLGGGASGPAISTNLSIRITSPTGETLWEGRSILETSVKSPYSEVGASARTLAAALFKDFPGGNGQTVSIQVDELNQ